MAFKMKRPTFGKSPLTQKKEDDVNKLQKGENPYTFVYEGSPRMDEDWNIQEKIIDLDDRQRFVETDLKEDRKVGDDGGYEYDTMTRKDKKQLKKTAKKLKKQKEKMKSLKNWKGPGSGL